MTDAPCRIVVVGSGLAGYAALRELRRVGPALTLTLVTADDGHFYSKPALSTALAKGKTPEALVTTPVEKMAAAQRFEARTGIRVEAIDCEGKRLVTDRGELDYDALVLALGADPVRPRLGGDAAGTAQPVNSLEDYARFRAGLTEDARVLILGAGLVGSEFANDLAAGGYRPVVVDMLGHPLAQLVPERVGRAIEQALATAGVEWHFHRSVTAIDRAGAGVIATLDDGRTIAADTVLSAVGLRPHVSLAQSAGLEVASGIKVDAHGRTSDPAIYALGDCAEYPLGPAAYVTPIMGAARAVAASIAGTPAAMRMPTLSVQVKTTACPLVLLPPPRGVAGGWSLVVDDADGQKALFLSPEGRTLGYALTRTRCHERSELDRAIAAEWSEAA